ncbi:MAG: NUDIX hydrolase [Planctomycetes bacterium]|nr:NUDIX hydrolase [Planctomycetota bacterium]
MAKKGKYVYEWPRPMVTADALVFGFFADKAKVLLVRRGKEPFSGIWAVPGGFVEMDEELADAAARELEEETGFGGVKLEQMHTFGTCGRDPRGRMITVVYMGVVEEPQKNVAGGSDAAEAKWFSIDALPVELAFDHADEVEMGIERLAGMDSRAAKQIQQAR